MERDTKSGRFLQKDSLERFNSKIIQNEGHWLWQGALIHGYGTFWNGEKQVLAHRFSYETLIGPIPEGLTLDHICRIRNCVFPAHLEPVSLQENLNRSPFKNICSKGHPFDKNWGGKRRCSICRNEKRRKNYRKKVGGIVRKYERKTN